MKWHTAALILFPLLGCDQADHQTHSEKQDNIIQIKQYNVEKEIPSSVNKVHSTSEKVTQNKKILLEVPLIKQMPELRYGCEVTSTAMMLQYAGVEVSKMDLYKAVKKDSDPLIKKNGNILHWGNPDDGFVGDMTGKNRRSGYAAFDSVIEDLVNEFLPGRAINLTGESFDNILNHVRNGYPVVIWTTGDYRLPNRWEEWEHKEKLIKTPLDLHVVVLVGFDENHVYLNDPLSGKKQVKVRKDQFIQSWEALKKRAISYI